MSKLETIHHPSTHRMPIHFYCPLGHRLVVPDEREGKKGRCPVCHQKVYVPVANPQPSGRKKQWPADFVSRAEPQSAPPADGAIDEILASELGIGVTPGIELDAPGPAAMFEPAEAERPQPSAQAPNVGHSDSGTMPTFDFDLPPPATAAKAERPAPPAPTKSTGSPPQQPQKAPRMPSAGYVVGPPPPPKSRNDGIARFEPITLDTFAPKSYDRTSGPWFRSVRPGMAIAALVPAGSMLQYVYLLCAAIIALGLLGATPALLHMSESSVPSWAGVALLLSAVEILVAMWIVSIPDASTLWIGMLVAALNAAAYGAAMAAVASTPIGQSPPLDLFEVRHTAGAWCGVNMVLNGAICYALGRASQSWQWRR
ncbi:MAG TPA: hypothetical protein VG713_03345 [Pirellulales bacterium]|nr:hypothetical protein [Pirellulales bacterium]